MSNKSKDDNENEGIQSNTGSPSDKVPQRKARDSAVPVPIPEATGLAASVSESFGVDLGTGEERVLPSKEMDDIPTQVGEEEEFIANKKTRPDTEDEVTDIGDEKTEVSSTLNADELAAIQRVDSSEAAGAENLFVGSDTIQMAAPARMESSSKEHEPAEEEDSIDIPFDDEEAENFPTEEAVSATSSRPRRIRRPSAYEEEAAIDAVDTQKASERKSDPKNSQQRFQRARTMALNEKDLEEVRGLAKSLEAQGVPASEASPVESGEVVDDADMEEVTEPPAPPTPSSKSTKSKAPPPPPPPVTTQKMPRKATADGMKSNRPKAWFEEIFDETYLRTLPFLTPQATQYEAAFVMESLGVEPGAQILDVGCGYGRHAMELAARGYQMVGLDNSMPLLLRGADEAQRRDLEINFVHGDMRDMSYNAQFDGAYCLFSTFGYFDDETNKRTAQNIANALKPGARFVVEVLNRDYLVADLPSRVWWEGDGCVVLEEVEFNYFSSRIVSNRSVVFDDGRQLENEISMRCFSLHELGKFLHAVGFRVLEISGSMSTRGRFFGAHSRDIVVVAERRGNKGEDS